LRKNKSMKDKIKQLIRFDWAMKRLLRNKVNFGILEGFLSELLQTDIAIIEILDAESNKETENDKFNRVDILVNDSKGELIIIEIQNDSEYDYFQRMLYGVSKAVSEHIDEGYAYSKVKKVIAVNLVYFNLGQGEDYVYYGETSFKGTHKKDILGLSKKQKDTFKVELVKDIFPEYYIIKVNNFDDNAQNTLDEWIYFFKNSAIKSNFSAKGIREAAEKLNIMKLSEKEKAAYKRYVSSLRDAASRAETLRIDTEDLMKEATQKAAEKATETTKQEMIIELWKLKVSVHDIAIATKYSEDIVKRIIEDFEK
jgi:predicted transposase/invertase (TIGR01784 family)